MRGVVSQSAELLMKEEEASTTGGVMSALVVQEGRAHEFLLAASQGDVKHIKKVRRKGPGFDTDWLDR